MLYHSRTLFMNNKLTILCLGLLSFATFALPNPTVNISIAIEDIQDEDTKNEIFGKALKCIHDICDATSCKVQLNLKQSPPTSTKEMGQEVSSDMQAFIDACNKHALKEGHNIRFSLDTHNDIVISCKETEPSYWQSVKSTATTKAKNAGGYIKDVAHTGAEKLTTAAYTVKEKTKKGIHTVAEKVSEFTE